MTLYIQPDNSIFDNTSCKDISREVVVGTLAVDPEFKIVRVCTSKRFHDRTGYHLQWEYKIEASDLQRVDTILLLME